MNTASAKPISSDMRLVTIFIATVFAMLLVEGALVLYYAQQLKNPFWTVACGRIPTEFLIPGYDTQLLLLAFGGAFIAINAYRLFPPKLLFVFVATIASTVVLAVAYVVESFGVIRDPWWMLCSGWRNAEVKLTFPNMDPNPVLVALASAFIGVNLYRWLLKLQGAPQSRESAARNASTAT